ncbi:MAG: hypothetical protein KGD61_00325 [Candidatus Lokiarchaeota archaeon]|nr:hypothetical protein [Candidatus Lokiarchaeota archaeon]
MKVSTGAIYHHLDALSQLIVQHDDKKYYLTELGLHAYNSLKDNVGTIITPDFSKKEFNSPILKGLMRLTPKKYINYESKSRYQILIISIIIMLTGAILCGLNGLFPFFLFFGESLINIELVDIVLKIVLALVFIGNMFFYFLINEGICRIFYKKKENSLRFLTSFAIILFPLDIYLLLRLILISTGSFGFASVKIIDNVLMISFQVWALWLLTYNLSVNKKLKIENSLIVSLLVHYGGFSIVLLIAI